MTLIDCIVKLSLEEGDILLVDPERIDIKALVDAGHQSGILKNIQPPMIPIICVFPKSGMTISEALRTCDLETLEKVVADMKGMNQ